MARNKEMVDVDVPMDLYLTVCKNCGFLKDDCCSGQCLKDSIC